MVVGWSKLVCPYEVSVHFDSCWPDIAGWLVFLYPDTLALDSLETGWITSPGRPLPTLLRMVVTSLTDPEMLSTRVSASFRLVNNAFSIYWPRLSEIRGDIH